MTQDKPILQELKELDSSLYEVRSGNVYLAPAGYFDSLAATVLSRVKALEANDAQEELNYLSPLLAGISKQSPFTVPSGYFEELEQVSYSSIFAEGQDAEEELRQLSPLLKGLKKENPYTVPAGYFDTLSGTAAAVEKQRAKVISFSRPKWIRYAAAAVVIAFVSVSGFFLFNKKEQIDPDTASYAWVEKNMMKVDTTDINEFLQLADETVAVTTSSEVAGEEVKELFKNVSDKEIQDFLNDVDLDGSEDDILN